MNIATRTTFKLLGVILTITGGLTVIYAIFFIPTFTYNIEVGGLDSEPTVVSGQTPLQRILVGSLGVLMIFLGYRSYKFIPYAEREKETVSELDLSPDEI